MESQLDLCARRVLVGRYRLWGQWTPLPDGTGVTVAVHGAYGSHADAGGRRMARTLQDWGQSTLSIDLLSPGEDADHRLAYDIPLLAQRLETALDWLAVEMGFPAHRVGLVGDGTAAAAALHVAARRPLGISAVVSQDGRADLACIAPTRIHAPTLLLVGTIDEQAIRMHQEMLNALRCTRRLDVVNPLSCKLGGFDIREVLAWRAGRWLAGHHEDAIPETRGA